MTHKQLGEELKLKGGFISVKRMQKEDDFKTGEKGCVLKLLNRALKGETVYFTFQNTSCSGANTGMGFTDGIPNTPGGFGYFISYGRGEGFPPGERVKCSPEVGEQMLLNQPQNVMNGFNCIRVKPHDDFDEADIVTAIATMDQISALLHIFNFRKTEYDNVIAPMSSGCASVFRIPFGELSRDNSRAVIGNMDVFSRPHFDANTAFFTVSGKDFKHMLSDADESVLTSPIWKGVKSRL